MTIISRRTLLTVLAAASAMPVAVSAARAQTTAGALSDDLDMEAVAAIAASYAAAAGANHDAAPFGGGAIDIAAIKASAARDFAEGRVFSHAGWRLSHTEGRLFALLART